MGKGLQGTWRQKSCAIKIWKNSTPLISSTKNSNSSWIPLQLLYKATADKTAANKQECFLLNHESDTSEDPVSKQPGSSPAGPPQHTSSWLPWAALPAGPSAHPAHQGAPAPAASGPGVFADWYSPFELHLEDPETQENKDIDLFEGMKRWIFKSILRKKILFY